MKRTPFLLFPAVKDYLWGGSRIDDDFGKNISIRPLAETWECSTHPDGESYISTTGQSLSAVLKENPTFLGSHVLETTGGVPVLPILIKLIDAKKNLSIQVHPDDEYALKHEGSWGKTEFWYVLDAKKEATLIYGFNQDMTEDTVKESVSKGDIDLYLNHVPVKKDDIFFIEAGTVHAIGAGVLIVEIQESSNITYRLFDYNRVDKYGMSRPIDLEKAMEVANLKKSSTPRQPMRLIRYQKGCAHELITRCKYFQVERMLLNTETNRMLVDYQTGSNSFHVLLCTDGCGSITSDVNMMNFFKGDCVFIPAESEVLKIHGKAQLLDISC